MGFLNIIDKYEKLYKIIFKQYSLTTDIKNEENINYEE